MPSKHIKTITLYNNKTLKEIKKKNETVNEHHKLELEKL